MKMNKCVYFILFMIISLQLIGMELPYDEKVSFYVKRYSVINEEGLHAIVTDSSEKYDSAQKEAASEILNQRAGLLGNTPKETNLIITGSEIVGALLVVWTAVETILAYNNISQNEWDEAKNVLYKLMLLARKTGQAMFSRPSQIINANKVLDKRDPEQPL